MTTQTITSTYAKLTKHPNGSLKELWHISFPLMITILSEYLMIFVDRLFLANYSTAAMNAAVIAGMTCFTMQVGFNSVSLIAEVFVGQYNGSKRYKEIGSPIWQMLYFSIAAFLIFIPIALYGGKFFLPKHYLAVGLGYFQWIMFFAPIVPMSGAVASFFIGRGQVKIVTIGAIVSNLVNFILDIILIFGVHGWVDPHGATGAAIATVIATIVNFLILFVYYCHPQFREKYGTLKVKFNPALFWECIRIGFPGSLGHIVEFGAWTTLLNLLARVSEIHVTMMSFGQTVLILFIFFTDGLQKGVISICANFIGAKQYQYVSKTLISAAKMAGIFILILVIPFIYLPDIFIQSFFSHDVNVGHYHTLETLLPTALRWLWVVILFDCIIYVLMGVLLAGADTKAILVLNIISCWMFAVLPIYLFVILPKGSASLIWPFFALFAFLGSLLFFLRYKMNVWQHNALSQR